MTDFSVYDQWQSLLLMVQDGMPLVLISTHWMEKKNSTCWIACSISDSQVMELSFFLFSDKNRLPPFPLLPAILCSIKMVINAAGWEGHY